MKHLCFSHHCSLSLLLSNGGRGHGIIAHCQRYVTDCIMHLKKNKKIPVHCTSQCFSLCTEYTAYWVNSRKVDLRVTKHHNVVSTTVDISLLHDDLPGDHPTVGCREVDFTLESCFDDWVLCLQNLIGTWVKLRHQDVHIICIHRIGTLGCCSLKLHVS